MMQLSFIGDFTGFNLNLSAMFKIKSRLVAIDIASIVEDGSEEE